MSLSIERMRALLRKGLGGLDAVDLPDQDADELLNLSLWELEDRFDFKEKECPIETPLIAGTAEYKLPSITDAVITVSLSRLSAPHERIKLIKMGWDEYSSRPNTVADVARRHLPMHYIRRDRTIIVDPVPNSSDWMLEIMTWRSVASLTEDITATIGLPRNWHELVVEGAVVRGHFYNEDYNIAQQASNFQATKVNSAVSTNTKEDRDNQYARVRVIHEWPDERNPPRRRGR